MSTTTIVWSVDWMKTSTQLINGHSEVVITAGWTCMGYQGLDTNTGIATTKYFTGGTSIFAEPFTGGSFTPFADLTQDQVLGWVWTDGVDKAEIESQVETQIAIILNPPFVQPPLPWSN
jgi:hypothetical protein